MGFRNFHWLQQERWRSRSIFQASLWGRWCHWRRKDKVTWTYQRTSRCSWSKIFRRQEILRWGFYQCCWFPPCSGWRRHVVQSKHQGTSVCLSRQSWSWKACQSCPYRQHCEGWKWSYWVDRCRIRSETRRCHLSSNMAVWYLKIDTQNLVPITFWNNQL